MRKLLLFVLGIISVDGVFAQACGTSGSTQCTVSGTLIDPGLSPRSDSLPPFINNVNSTTVIQFRNFNVVYYNNLPFTLQSLRIDTIDNLPNGLCWASDKVDDTYINSENGCIKVNGIPCDSTGQYKLRIIATATLVGGFSLQVDAASVGLFYYLRVINSGDPLTPVDTLTSIPFVPYGGICQSSPPVVTLGTDQTVCNGSSVTLNSSVSGGTPPYTYLWSTTGNSVSCDTCASPTVTLTQNSTYILVVTDAANSIGRDTIAYTVIGAGGNFNITANGTTSLCLGNSVTLHAPQNALFTNQWKRNGVDIAGETDSTYTVTDSSGAYSVAYSSGSCNATSNTINVTVGDTPSVNISPVGPLAICQGSSVTLQSTATSGVTYLWQLNGNNLNTAVNATYSALLGGTYTLVVRNADNCADTSNAIILSINPLPTVTLSALIPDTLCTTSSAVTLTGGNPAGGVYGGIGVTGNTFSPSTSGTGSHTISYTYTDGNTCSNTATQTVVVRLCTDIGNLDIADFVTIYPNPSNLQIVVASDFMNEINTSFRIYDVTGKMVTIPFINEGNHISFDISTLPGNVYWIKLNVGGKEISKRFIKMD